MLPLHPPPRIQLIFALVPQTQGFGPQPSSLRLQSLLPPSSLRPRISDPNPPPTATGVKIPALLFQTQGDLRFQAPDLLLQSSTAWEVRIWSSSL